MVLLELGSVCPLQLWTAALLIDSSVKINAQGPVSCGCGHLMQDIRTQVWDGVSVCVGGWVGGCARVHVSVCLCGGQGRGGWTPIHSGC
jgi:hypothetical protein